MELAYSVMFSLPGTPVLFYGEEIGMGDDQSLPERHAVRTAMQWSSDDGAGFSGAPRPAMPRPPVKDGPLGYRRVNVEDQRARPDSFLNWMERLIRTRRQWPEIGWGEWRLIASGEDAVLAHAMTWQGGDVVVVHNFADHRVKVALSMPRPADGPPWRHLLGPERRRKRPVVEDGRLEVDLGPYEYHWFGRRAFS
jgi:maltose alpha-D-glucosyltransferase/alpha-amylase